MQLLTCLRCDQVTEIRLDTRQPGTEELPHPKGPLLTHHAHHTQCPHIRNKTPHFCSTPPRPGGGTRWQMAPNYTQEVPGVGEFLEGTGRGAMPKATALLSTCHHLSDWDNSFHCCTEST